MQLGIKYYCPHTLSTGDKTEQGAPFDFLETSRWYANIKFNLPDLVKVHSLLLLIFFYALGYVRDIFDIQSYFIFQSKLCLCGISQAVQMREFHGCTTQFQSLIEQLYRSFQVASVKKKKKYTCENNLHLRKEYFYRLFHVSYT